ncbi:MAG: F0F1 ATP synthase subunit A [Actinomycetota bacterium]|nr:F0F1 ATP synthase subunit A [Actinomycetota bacterium]
MTSFAVPRLLASSIGIGQHVVAKIAGLTFDLDTLWATGVAMVVVIALGLVVARKATNGVPGKLQLAWEMGLEAIQNQVEGTIGSRGRAVIPLALSLFVFILVANWLTTFETGAKYEILGPPAADINFTLALAIVVIVPVHIASVRARGVRGYVSHYFKPYKVLFPINVVEEVAKPITLALRLFGNLLSSVLMVALLAALGVWTLAHFPVGDVSTLVLETVWKLFDLLIGAIQAFIFALLTILYFDAAMSGAH